MAGTLDLSGYDKEAAEMWEDVYEDMDFWKNITEEEIITECNMISERCDSFYKQLRRMFDDCNYDKTDKLMQDLLNNSLSRSGWMGTFLARNRGHFPNASHDRSKPGWLSSCTPEEQAKYGIIAAYYRDILRVINAMDDLYKLLLELKLKDANTMLLVRNNFWDAGYDEDLYARVNGEIRDVYDRVSISPDRWEYIAQKAEDYYKQNVGNKSKSALNEGYRKVRMECYLNDVKRFPFFTNSFSVNSNGDFSVKPEIALKASVIDQYTNEISELKNIKDDLKKIMDDCKKIEQQDLNPFATIMETDAVGHVQGMFRFVNDEVYAFAENCIKEYEAFYAPKEKKPYIFMKRLPVIDEISTNPYISPDKSAPSEHGTDYAGLYSQAARALSTHCKNFVYYVGHQELR